MPPPQRPSVITSSKTDSVPPLSNPPALFCFLARAATRPGTTALFVSLFSIHLAC